MSFLNMDSIFNKGRELCTSAKSKAQDLFKEALGTDAIAEDLKLDEQETLAAQTPAIEMEPQPAPENSTTLPPDEAAEEELRVETIRKKVEQLQREQAQQNMLQKERELVECRKATVEYIEQFRSVHASVLSMEQLQELAALSYRVDMESSYVFKRDVNKRIVALSGTIANNKKLCKEITNFRFMKLEKKHELALKLLDLRMTIGLCSSNCKVGFRSMLRRLLSSDALNEQLAVPSKLRLDYFKQVEQLVKDDVELECDKILKRERLQAQSKLQEYTDLIKSSFQGMLTFDYTELPEFTYQVKAQLPSNNNAIWDFFNKLGIIFSWFLRIIAFFGVTVGGFVAAFFANYFGLKDPHLIGFVCFVLLVAASIIGVRKVWNPLMCGNLRDKYSSLDSDFNEELDQDWRYVLQAIDDAEVIFEKRMDEYFQERGRQIDSENEERLNVEIDSARMMKTFYEELPLFKLKQ